MVSGILSLEQNLVTSLHLLLSVQIQKIFGNIGHGTVMILCIQDRPVMESAILMRNFNWL